MYFCCRVHQLARIGREYTLLMFYVFYFPLMKPSTSLTIFVIFFGLLSLSIVSVDANTYPIVPKDPILCTMQYAPVCGYTPVQCVSAPCEPIRQTYGNSCMASVAGAIEITQGTCDDTIPTTPAPV